MQPEGKRPRLSHEVVSVTFRACVRRFESNAPVGPDSSFHRSLRSHPLQGFRGAYRRQCIHIATEVIGSLCFDVPCFVRSDGGQHPASLLGSAPFELSCRACLSTLALPAGQKRVNSSMSKEIYISSTPHETRLAIVENDNLAEMYYERENEYTLAGSIYNGKVTRVLPGMQSSFVDIGLERDAFLYITDFMEEAGDTADFEASANSGDSGRPRSSAGRDNSSRQSRDLQPRNCRALGFRALYRGRLRTRSLPPCCDRGSAPRSRSGPWRLGSRPPWWTKSWQPRCQPLRPASPRSVARRAVSSGPSLSR